MTSGKLIGVGVGPGDPGLLTLKAVAAIEASPVIAYLSAEGEASLARNIVAAHLRADHTEVPLQAPMRLEPEVIAGFYDRSAKTPGGRARGGARRGAACLATRCSMAVSVYLLDRLRHRFAFEVVPGIMSSRRCRLAARAGAGAAPGQLRHPLLPPPRRTPEALIAAADEVADPRSAAACPC